MAEQPGSQGEDADPVTQDMLLNVIQRRATPEEMEIVRAAFRKPHSKLHDWLEAVEEWAAQMFGGKLRHAEAGDQMIEAAVARRYREDVVSFLHRKRAEGKLSQENLSALLVEGKLSSPPAGDSETLAYHQSATRMLELAARLQPVLSSEIQRLIRPMGQDKS